MIFLFVNEAAVLQECSYLLKVLIDVMGGDRWVGDEVKQLSDRHHRHAMLHKELWVKKTQTDEMNPTLQTIDCI